MQRRLPPPWTATDLGNCFVVTDANGVGIANIPYAREVVGTNPETVLSKDEARRVAAGICRLPELMGRPSP